MLRSVALGVGAIVTGGIGFAAKRSSSAAHAELDEIESLPPLSIRNAVSAMRNHPREDNSVIAADFSMQGITWAPEERIIVRQSLTEPGNFDGFAIERTEPTHYESLEQAASDSLFLIDGSSFERTGLDVFGSGDIPPEELARRRKLSETFSYEDLKDIDPKIFQQTPEATSGAQSEGGFMSRMLGGSKKNPEDIIGPLFWAQPSEERPGDCFEKRAGGVWISLPRELVSKSFYAPMGPAPAASLTDPSAAASSAAPAGGMGVPVGAPVFIHGTFGYDGSGSLMALNPKIVANQTRDEFIATRRAAADSAGTLGLACLGISGALAAGAVYSTVRMISAKQE